MYVPTTRAALEFYFFLNSWIVHIRYITKKEGVTGLIFDVEYLKYMHCLLIRGQ